MRKRTLVVLSWTPLLIGWVINLVMANFGVSFFVFYILPFLTAIFWFLLGRQFGKTDWNAPMAILIGNAAGLVSLLLYLWQFWLVSDENRSMFLAGLSQMFAASAPTYLFGGLATLFEPDPNTIGRVSFLTLQVLGVLLMIVVFTAGYWFGRIRRSAEQTAPAESMDWDNAGGA